MRYLLSTWGQRAVDQKQGSMPPGERVGSAGVGVFRPRNEDAGKERQRRPSASIKKSPLVVMAAK